MAVSRPDTSALVLAHLLSRMRFSITVRAAETVNHGEVAGGEKYSGSKPGLLSATELHAAAKTAHTRSRHVPGTIRTKVEQCAGWNMRQLAM